MCQRHLAKIYSMLCHILLLFLLYARTGISAPKYWLVETKGHHQKIKSEEIVFFLTALCSEINDII